jgi:hypothetical protein
LPKKIPIPLLLALLSAGFLSAQETKYTLNGYIQDSASGEALIGANMLIKELNIGSTSNLYGFFSISAPRAKYTLVVDYVGYERITQQIDLNGDTKLVFNLKQEKELLKEVVVNAEAEDKNVQSNQMSISKVSIKDLKRMPAMMGEVDVLRSIQLMPGISTVGEGAAGFNVRGGTIDQNLVLLDDAPVYNSSHLFGLFSVFNPDAVKDIKLMKGGFPAQYGGRLSSILDVRLKEGNNREYKVSGGVGTVSSRITAEGPIVKNKGSFIVAARRSYADMFLKLNKDTKENSLFFYDLSTKANYSIDSNNRVFLSGYFGKDVFEFGKDFFTSWGNQTATARWNHIFNSKVFFNITGVLSNFNYSLGVPQGAGAFDWKSFIKTYSLKSDFTYYLSPKNTLSFGQEYVSYKFEPGNSKPLGDISIFNPLDIEDQRARELAFYVSNETKINPKFSLDYGLRFSMFQYLGGRNVYDFSTEEKGKQLVLVGTRYFDKGETVKTYGNIEPRISARMLITEYSSLKISYNRMAQYIHLLSPTLASSPLDIWTPSTNNIKPQTANQFAIGYFKNYRDNKYEFSVESYYKRMQNQIDYINGASILLNQLYEADLMYGVGRAYGLELMAKKSKGKMQGWLSYTLSKTERKIEGINNDEWFNSKFDRPHNIALVAMYELNEKWNISANFSLSSGSMATFPNARYEYQGVVVPHNTNNERNNFRMPTYHRLDISATYRRKPKSTRRFQSEWVFTVYNVYNRRNAFTVFFRQNKDNPNETEAIRLSVLGSVLPSVTYNFKF